MSKLPEANGGELGESESNGSVWTLPSLKKLF